MTDDYTQGPGAFRRYLSDLYTIVKNHKTVSATLFVAGILAPTAARYFMSAADKAIPTAEANSENVGWSFTHFGPQNIKNVKMGWRQRLNGDQAEDMVIIADQDGDGKNELILLENRME